MFSQDKTTSLPELTAILLARLGFLWLLVFVSLLLPNDYVAFYAFMGVAFIITIPYSLWLRNKLRATQFAPLQFVVDLVLVTGLVYFTGGVQSDLTLLYPLVILSAGIVGTPGQATEITVLAIIIYVLMATLLSNRMLIEFIPADSTLQKSASTSAIFLRSITFAVFGIASIYVAKRCTYLNTHKLNLVDTASTLLKNIPSPSLLLDRNGTILFANKPAGDALDVDEQDLHGIKFGDLCVEHHDPIPKKYGETHYFSHKNTPPFPVSCQSVNFNLLETALQESTDQEQEIIEVTLLTFSDISHPLETERQLEKVERITAATRIAGEMAHEIRTPLTAISASVQLLQCFEKQATSADWLPNSPRRTERAELFAHIEEASHKMDDVIQNFIDFAEFSPSDLLSIIKLDSSDENQGYIGHLNTLGRDLKHVQNIDSGRRSDNSQLVE